MYALRFGLLQETIHTRRETGIRRHGKQATLSKYRQRTAHHDVWLELQCLTYIKKLSLTGSQSGDWLLNLGSSSFLIK